MKQSNANRGARFGAQVALSEDGLRVAVLVEKYDHAGGRADAGAVLVFRRTAADATDWSLMGDAVDGSDRALLSGREDATLTPGRSPADRRRARPRAADAAATVDGQTNEGEVRTRACEAVGAPAPCTPTRRASRPTTATPASRCSRRTSRRTASRWTSRGRSAPRCASRTRANMPFCGNSPARPRSITIRGLWRRGSDREFNFFWYSDGAGWHSHYLQFQGYSGSSYEYDFVFAYAPSDANSPATRT